MFAPAPKLLVQGALGSDVGAYALAAAGLMLVTVVESLLLFPPVELDWLAEVLLCVCPCPCFCEPPVAVLVFVLLELPLFLTPLVDVELPPVPPVAVAVPLPPVAFALELLFDALLAVLLEDVLLGVVVGGVVGGTGVGTQMNAMPSTTS